MPRYRLLVVLAAITTLRFGELAALRRRDIGLEALTVTAADCKQSAAVVIEQATREFPNFDDTIMELCR
ncbi:hypothetical protein [Streptomyces sp. NPDC093261]|uniref:hypothetical protein n=1 Tax=Streptomyces sp. NPDC093261 TaxID=3366037 RepID=UPI003824E9A7